MNRPQDNEQEAIDDFLGDRPKADQLRDWRVTLEQRLEALEAEMKRPGANVKQLQTKIQQTRKQVAALRQEEAVTEFVEDSVRVTLAMGQIADPVDEQEGSR